MASNWPTSADEFTVVVNATPGVADSGTTINSAVLTEYIEALEALQLNLGNDTDDALLGGYDDLAARLTAQFAAILDLDTWGDNLSRNFPAIEAADGATPDLWNVTNDETVTNEDAAGESIPQKHLRVYKVTMSADGGGVDFVYQDFDEVDEDLLDDDVTEVSAGVWVYQKSTDTYGTITLELYDVDGAASLGTDTMAAQDTWTFLSVQGKTYQDSMRWRLGHSANDAIFYLCMPMLNVGLTVRPWRERVSDFLLVEHNEDGTHGNTKKLRCQVVADATARGNISSPREGDLVWQSNTDMLYVYDGAAWGIVPGAGHNVLGIRHIDSETDAATQGSLIYGNATPKWDELPVGTAGQHLESDGTDVSWVTNLVMPDGATIGQAAGPLVAFDDTNNYLEITGCDVGIGTTGPVSTLDLRTSTADVGAILTIGTLDTTINVSDILGTIEFRGLDAETYTDQLGAKIVAAVPSGWSGLVQYDNPSDLLFYTQSDGAADGLALPRMVIANTGNVGIGTTGPDRLLHAEVDDAVTNAVTYAQRLSHITSGTAAANFGTGIEFELEGADGTFLVTGAIENILTDASTGSEDADLIFKASAAGAVAAEQFRIASDGGLFAQTLLQQSAAGLVVEYDAATKELYAETSALAFKRNVQPLAMNTAGIFGLSPKQWTDKASGREEFGLIAEEVAGAFPDLAVYGPDGPLGVKYHKLSVLLLEEVKRLRAEVGELRDRLH